MKGGPQGNVPFSPVMVGLAAREGGRGFAAKNKEVMDFYGRIAALRAEIMDRGEGGGGGMGKDEAESMWRGKRGSVQCVPCVGWGGE